MQQKLETVNTTAPLANVALCRETLERAINRPRHLDGMVCFYGPSGYGKSFAAAYAITTHRAYYVEYLDCWTKKAFAENIARRLGLQLDKTVPPTHVLIEMICEQLATSLRPLIIDEMHLVVERGAVELVRDIYKRSKAAIMLIGEEQLPGKLKRWEAFDGRILHWQPAQPADWSDACQLRQLYVKPPIEIADDLLQHVLERTRGSVRRICNNLELMQDEARENGWTVIDRKTWANRAIFTGEAPKRGN